MSEQQWRVVEDSMHNVCLYRGDERVAVVLGGADLAEVRAREIIAVLNRADAPTVDHDTWADGIPLVWGQP